MPIYKKKTNCGEMIIEILDNGILLSSPFGPCPFYISYASIVSRLMKHEDSLEVAKYLQSEEFFCEKGEESGCPRVIGRCLEKHLNSKE